MNGSAPPYQGVDEDVLRLAAQLVALNTNGEPRSGKAKKSRNGGSGADPRSPQHLLGNGGSGADPRSPQHLLGNGSIQRETLNNAPPPYSYGDQYPQHSLSRTSGYGDINGDGVEPPYGTNSMGGYTDYGLDLNYADDSQKYSSNDGVFKAMSVTSSSSNYSILDDESISSNPSASNYSSCSSFNNSGNFPNGFAGMGEPLSGWIQTAEKSLSNTRSSDRGDNHSHLLSNSPDEWGNQFLTPVSSMIGRGNDVLQVGDLESSHFSSASGELTAMVWGPGVIRAVRGRTSSFQIMINDAPSSASFLKESLKVNIVVLSNRIPCVLKIKQVSSCAFSIRYKPNFEEAHEASITINGVHVKGSPWRVEVGSQHRYQGKGQVKCIIRNDDTGNPCLNEPWGVCCNADGYVFIGDRSSHMVRAYKPNYVYSHSIGSHGSLPGELNKPAGVAVNSNGEIVVADKDNHRIQVFNFQGQVQLVFGEFGANTWQLNYPWDVTVAPGDAILVSDSRNGRVSLFSADGNFQRDINQENTILKYPRGLCYREYDEKIIATDMNKHQIIVLDLFDEGSGDGRGNGTGSFNRHPSVIGRKGSDPNEYQRPQGVACDDEGNIIVADCKNQRIQVVDAEGNHLNQWEVESPDPGSPAQPMGVAVSPATGDILVVDGEHNRVVVY